MAERSRRSFFVDLLSTLAGGWVTVTGLVTAASALGGCSDDTGSVPKYGGPNPEMTVKYGGPADGGQKDLGPVVKYGGPGDGGYKDGMIVKYGGFDLGGQKDLGPVVKYGGFDGGKKDGSVTTKYGGIPIG